ncbi:MAG: response regulator [bacterium]|nr:response regulator [bacterium]
MAISRDAFIDNYLDELKENTESVDSGILTLKKDPANEDELTRLLRALHTIKGSSRMLKFNHIEKIVHGLENVFKGIKEERYGITKSLIQLVFITTDYLRAGARQIKEHKSDEALSLEKILDVFEKACSNEPYSLDGLKLAPEPQPEPPPEVGQPEAAEAAEETGVRRAPGKDETSETIAGYETIRIKLSKTDKMIKLLNNLIIKQFQLRKENDVLNSLEKKFRDLMSMNAGGDRKGDGGKEPEYVKKENDYLKHIQQLRKDFGLDLTLLERNTFELQEEILSLRMLPLELILGSLDKMVEETAINLDKEIDFTVSGADVMIDKIILEKLNDPIIHLVRNSIDHGIEMPEEREAKGKNRVGQLGITCYLESGNIIVKIKDDGKGLDYDKILEKAIRLNPIQEEEIRALDTSGLNAFLFASGFSTKEKVQELSGRGVGLDIVKYNIENIKGKIALESEKGKGTEFTLTLPLSLATVEGFFIACAREKFLIPATFVKEVLIINENQRLNLVNGNAIKLRNQIIPIYNLSAILGKNGHEPEEREGKIFVMIVESLSDMIGIVVDSIIQYASLIYKPLPPNLSKLKLLQGIVFDESYNIINILYIPEVMTRFKGLRGLMPAQQPAAKLHKQKSILVVDDSYSTREIERSILELEDFHVVTANDGIDGLEKLEEFHFDLIVTDINMPHMDGLAFVENLKQQDVYKYTPIIVVSSVEDPTIREAFASKGIHSYIIKSDFDRGNLVLEVKNLIG